MKGVASVRMLADEEWRPLSFAVRRSCSGCRRYANITAQPSGVHRGRRMADNAQPRIATVATRKLDGEMSNT